MHLLLQALHRVICWFYKNTYDTHVPFMSSNGSFPKLVCQKKSEKLKEEYIFLFTGVTYQKIRFDYWQDK